MQTATKNTRSPPVEMVKQRDYLSFSAISLYQSCPLRYYFRYVLGLPEQITTASLAFGSAMHAAVQFHFEQLLAVGAVPDLDTLLDVFWSSWNTHEKQAIQFGKGEDVSTISKLADKMLLAFRGSDFSRPQGTIIGVEEELRCELIPGCPDLLARVDLIVDTEEALVITDFKTSRRTWSQEQVADAAPQLLLYSEVAKTLADGKAIRLGFAVMTKTQTPDLAIHPVTLNEHQIERTKSIVERVWRSIQTGHFYPNPSPLNCPTCPFREPCRAWAG